jgi:16S rRNA (uracil1498-N3)-methyltransferase
MHRFFVPADLTPGTECHLPADVSHHIRKVLRLRDGEPIALWNGDGQLRLARLTHKEAGLHARVESTEPVQAPEALKITLMQGLPEGDKMDWIVEKACEIGVCALWPVQAHRSVVRLHGERLIKRQAHWQRVAIAACSQSGRTWLPTLYPVCDSQQAFGTLAQTTKGALLWCLSPSGVESAVDAFREFVEARQRKTSQADEHADPAPPHLILAVGPEGGWDDKEEGAAKSAGFGLICLGQRVLRTETAGLYASAQAQAWLGLLHRPQDRPARQ